MKNDGTASRAEASVKASEMGVAGGPSRWNHAVRRGFELEMQRVVEGHSVGLTTDSK